MSGPVSDATVRAFLLGVAGDSNATRVTPEALRSRADGLLGAGRADGTVDRLETEALLTVARQSGLGDQHIEQLRAALRDGTHITIPPATGSEGPTRFPPYMDFGSLERVGRKAREGGFEGGVYRDRGGNRMELRPSQDAPSGVSARFAPASQQQLGPEMHLTPAEVSALAPHFAAMQLRLAQGPMSDTSANEWAAIAATHRAPTTPPAGGERDLSTASMGGSFSLDNTTGQMTEQFGLPSGETLYVRHNRKQPNGLQMAVSSSGFSDPPDSAYRPMTAGEVSTFLESRRLSPVNSELWVRNFNAAQAFRALTRQP